MLLNCAAQLSNKARNVPSYLASSYLALWKMRPRVWRSPAWRVETPWRVVSFTDAEDVRAELQKLSVSSRNLF